MKSNAEPQTWMDSLEWPRQWKWMDLREVWGNMWTGCIWLRI